jgi:MFS-type transporter involved in bile tolerance (Atg22 family)
MAPWNAKRYSSLITRYSLLVHGLFVAPLAIMARRVAALFAMVVLLGLVLVLMWRVYVHHENSRELEEPSVLALDAGTA